MRFTIEMRRFLQRLTLIIVVLSCVHMTSKAEETATDYTILMGHRGLVALAPENTLPSFAVALELRMDIELDVFLTADGEVVVIHDETVDRTTNGRGIVTEMNLAELRALDAGSWFDPDFVGERIPTLRETLALIKTRQHRLTTVAINMKTISPGIEKKIVEEVQKQGMLNQVYCFGMNAQSNARFKNANPKLATAIQTHGFDQLDLTKSDDWDRATRRDDAEVLWVNFLPSREQIAAAHNHGKRVWLSIRDDRDLMREAARSTVNGICSDYVLEIRAMRQTK